MTALRCLKHCGMVEFVREFVETQTRRVFDEGWINPIHEFEGLLVRASGSAGEAYKKTDAWILKVIVWLAASQRATWLTLNV